MDVNQTEESEAHLLNWALVTAKQFTHPGQSYSLETLVKTGILSQLLRDIDDDSFGSLGDAYEGLEAIMSAIEDFLGRQCCKRVKIAARNRVLSNGDLALLFELVLYCSLHCKDKQKYGAIVLGLSQQVQGVLMGAIEEVSSQLTSIVNHADLLGRVEELEAEVEMMRQELSLSSSRELAARKVNDQLEQQLNKCNHEIKSYKSQKQRALETLQMSNIDEYLTAFQRLQQENRALSKYVQSLEESGQQYKTQMQQMKKQIESEQLVINDLSQHIDMLKKQLRQTKLQLNTSLQADKADLTRSFGREISLNSKQNRRRGRSKLSQASEQEPLSSQQPKHPVCNEAFLEQMAELRKYNSELIHKLDTVFKTMHNLTLEASNTKEANSALQRENRFYRRQIRELSKLHARMQEDLEAGRI